MCKGGRFVKYHGLEKRPPSDGNLAVMWAFTRIRLMANVRQISLLEKRLKHQGLELAPADH
jgi:hypothetical protein